MSRPYVNTKLLRHMISQWVLGEHTFDGFGQEFSRVLLENMLRRCGLESPRETAMSAIEFRRHFIAGQMNFFRVHNHNMDSHIDMGSKGRPVFAPQPAGRGGLPIGQAFSLPHSQGTTFPAHLRAFAYNSTWFSPFFRYRVAHVSCTSCVPISFDSSFASQASRFVVLLRFKTSWVM